MLIRMTGLGSFSALFAAGALAVGGLVGSGSTHPGSRTALVIDAEAARDGRDLVDPRLRALEAEIRLPRTWAEALTNVRYFEEQRYRVVVAGPLAGAAAEAAGTRAVHGRDLAGALAAVELDR
jgi:hypothetical protein